MKKLICIAVTGVILITCVCVSALASSQNESSAAAVEQEAPTRYVIKSEGGRLVVYRRGQEKPFMSTETFSANLPRGDADRLEKGVEVEGETALRKTLEDYCS